MRRPPATTVLWALAAGIGYFLAARGGTLLVANPEGLAAVWLASGVLLAALLASDGRHWRAIGVFTLVAAAASALVDGNPTPATAVASAAGWAEGLLAAVIVTRLLGGRPSLARMRDIGALAAAIAVACAAGALAGAAGLASEAGNALGSTWINWWSADAVGMLAIAPLAIALRESAGRRPSRRSVIEGVALLGALVAVSLVVFGADPGVGGLRSALPAALALPLLVLAGARLGALPAALGGLVLTLIAARMTIEEHGPFANAVASTADRLLGMRAFLAIALGTSLAVVALAAERRRSALERDDQTDMLKRAKRQRNTEQRRVQELIGTAFDAVITIDEDGLVTDWNPAAQRTFGWSRTEAVGRPLTATILPANLRLPYEATLELLRRAGEVSGIGERIELEACRRDGREAPVELTLSSIRGEDGLSFHLVANDLSEMRALEEQRASAEARIKAAEAQVAKSEEDRRRIAEEVRRARLQATRAELLERAAAAEYERRLEDGEHERLRLERSFDDAPIGMALADPGGRLSRVNTALSELTGLPRERLETITVEELARSGDRELVRAGLRPLLERRRGRWQGEVRLVAMSDREIPVDLGVTILREGDEAPFLLVHAEDLRERRVAQERVTFLADHDFLTGLPDRGHVEAELERSGAGAVVVLDLDGLRSLNDALGRPAGDALLAQASRALREHVRRSDAVARIGGDAFAVVLEGAGEADARGLGEELLEAVRSVEASDGRTVSASAGVLLFTGAEGLSAEQLLVEAELAVYDAKEAGRNRMVVRRAAGHRRAPEGERGWADRLREALQDDCFVLHGQPIVSLKGEPPSRYELLLRLLGDDGDLIPPATFLYIAERFGLAQELDRWVIGQAAAMLARAHDAGRELLLEVNLSASSVADRGLSELIARELQAANAPGSGLSLAIDEATAIENMEAVRALAQSVRGLGCELVLDHFGSGLASFHYLQQLAVDYVKIDGSFVKDLPHNRAGRMVVKSVVEVAGSLGCRTIAERVGDSETLALLQGQGVDYAQGFYVGRPRPAVELELGSPPPEDGAAVQSI